MAESAKQHTRKPSSYRAKRAERKREATSHPGFGTKEEFKALVKEEKAKPKAQRSPVVMRLAKALEKQEEAQKRGD